MTLTKDETEVLSQQEEYELIKCYQLEGDQDALAELLKHNERLITKITSGYVPYNSELYEDALQEARMGLIEAINKYDLDSGNKLSTYACHWIRQRITRFLMNYSRTIRIPVHLNEILRKIKVFSKKFVVENEREPTDEEIGNALDLNVSQVKSFKNIESNIASIASLNSPVGKGTNEDSSDELGDFIPDYNHGVEDEVAQNILAEELGEIINSLSEREQKVIRLRFGMETGYPMTLEEVAHEFGLTRERIRQIESSALKKLRIRCARKGFMRTYM